MTPAFIIRPATPLDVKAIAVLLTELNRIEGQDVVTTPEAIAEALFAPNREVALHALVAEDGNDVVGMLLYYAGYDTLSASVGHHLADMVVAATHRRTGLGRALVRELARITLAQQKEWISLTALTRNKDAQAFYRTLGMTQVAVDFFAMGKQALRQL